MEGLKLEDFAGHVGESWEVVAEGGNVPLRLAGAQPLPRGVRQEGAFRLEWVGPAAQALPQAIHLFRRGGDTAEIFIVPIAREGDELRYEAIFM